MPVKPKTTTKARTTKKAKKVATEATANKDEGVNILEEFEFDEHQLRDVSEETTLFWNELTLEERERLMALSEAELVDEGWTLASLTRFSGPLFVEAV